MAIEESSFGKNVSGRGGATGSPAASTADGASLAKAATELRPLSAYALREFGVMATLLAKGLPPDP